MDPILPGDVVRAGNEYLARPLAIDESYITTIRAAMANPHGVSAATRPPVRSRGGTAVLAIRGPLQQRADIFSQIFGGTGYDEIRAAYAQALADPAVTSIVLDVDSPGGEVFGLPELADFMFASRGVKPTTAIANPFTASAAYYIASQVDEVVVAPSGLIGSIGTYMLHVDQSGMLESLGIRPTFVSAGKYKTEGNPFEPLSEAAREDWQSKVDAWYGEFVDAVARGRGVTSAVVRSDMGQGRMLMPAAAVRAGMADRVATFETVLERHGSAVASAPARARADAADEGRDNVPSTEALYALHRRR